MIGKQYPLGAHLTIAAGKLDYEDKLPLADSIDLATARASGAMV